MVMHTLQVRLTSAQVASIDSLVVGGMYASRSDAVRDAVRNRISSIEKEKALCRLAKIKGSLKGKAILSYESARELAGQDMVRKHGIRLD